MTFRSPAAVSLAVVISTHYPQGDNALLLPAVLIAIACAILAGLVERNFGQLLQAQCHCRDHRRERSALWRRVRRFRRRAQNNDHLAGRDRRRPGAGASQHRLFRARRVAGGFIRPEKVRRRKALRSDRRQSIGYPRRGTSGAASSAVGLRLCPASLLHGGRAVAGITREPTAFQGDSLLLPSVAVVVLGGTSLLGGRGFPISTVIAAFFLNQLSQFALAVGVPYSAQTIIQALALGFGIGVYSIRWTVNAIKQTNTSVNGGKNEVLG